MKRKVKANFLMALLNIVALAGLHAQDTAFTYQGQLLTANGPANGIYDLQFALFDAGTNGNQLGMTQTNEAVVISNGLFTATVDFGNQYPPSPCWLAVGVRSNGVASFSALSPREQITPTPYAIMAFSSSNLLGALPAVQISGSLNNTQLANSSVTVNAGAGLSGGGVLPLGGSTTLNNAGVTALSEGGGVTVSGSTGAVRLGSTATSTNTANTIVSRDGSGNFSAETITLAGSLNLPAPADIYSEGQTVLHADGNKDNLFIGVDAGNLTASGTGNTASGNTALSHNLSGHNNTASGADSLSYNTSGYDNTADGYLALYFNTNGYDNTAVGFNSLASNTSGYENTAEGVAALYLNTTGYRNTASGAGALLFNRDGIYNTAEGYHALYSNTNGIKNTANGFEALYANTSGNNNTANGYLTLGNNISGNDNTADGYAALYSNITGEQNTASGRAALWFNTNGVQNTADGYEALFHNASGSANTANGTFALIANTSGDYNTANGFQALYSNTSGYDNTAIGDSALFGNTSGIENIAVGYSAGSAITIGNFNIDIGNSGQAGDSGIIRIGTQGTQTATYLAGTVYANGVALTSDRNAKERFRSVDSQQVLSKVTALPITEWNYKTESATQKHIGPMAQDFHAAFGVNGTDDKHISVIDEGGVALAAIQGLNQKMENELERRDTENAELKQEVENLEQIVRKLSQKLDGGAQ